LHDVKMTKANLQARIRSNLSNDNFIEADLTEATLVAADFTMTNVTGVNFDKANLIDLWLKGVDLFQALNLFISK
jgi:uncharacterized protein YjbI with pentapeptide repeats